MRCMGNDDCPNGRCVDGDVANQCEDGEERPCETECGCQKLKRCVRPCPQPTTEICGDGRDNDCDQQADEGCQVRRGAKTA